MKKILLFHIFLSIAAIWIFLSTAPVGAITFENPSKINTITELLDAILNFLYALSFPILTAVVLYAGFLMVTSGGKPEQFSKAIWVIVYAAIGFIVILLSKGLVFVLQDILKK